jgi:hypothetical protein
VKGDALSAVEPDSPQWRKSTKSAQNNCVEVATGAGVVLVRDSKNPGGPTLRFTPAQWMSFLYGLRSMDSPSV